MTAPRDDAPLELEHPGGCWMDPRPHLHRLTLLERPLRADTPDRLTVALDDDPGGPVALLGLPRPAVRRAPE